MQYTTSYLGIASDLKVAGLLSASLDSGALKLSLSEDQEAVSRFIQKGYGSEWVDVVKSWINQVSERPLPLSAMSGVRYGSTRSEILAKAQLPVKNADDTIEVIFQSIPYPILILLSAESDVGDIAQHATPDGPNFLAYTPSQLVGISLCYECECALDIGEKSYKVVKSSQTIKFSKELSSVSLAFMLLRYHYMKTCGILGKRPPQAPVSFNILGKILDSWCRSSSIEITDALKKTHQSGVLTQGEAEKMWKMSTGENGFFETLRLARDTSSLLQRLVQEGIAVRLFDR